MGLAPARAKEAAAAAAKQPTNGAKVATAGAATGAAAGSVLAGKDEEPEHHDEEPENSHDLESSGYLEEPTSESHTDLSFEHITQSGDENVSQEHEQEPEFEEEGTSIMVSHDISVSPLPHEPEVESEVEAVSESHEQAEDHEAAHTEYVEESKSQAHAGDDIDDMVKLLQTAPSLSKAVSDIPDDTPDIPDEE